MSDQYRSGAASLFSVIARTMGDVGVICPYCFSEDVDEVDHEYGICECRNCETRFERPSRQPTVGVDRDGQGGPPAGG